MIKIQDFLKELVREISKQYKVQDASSLVRNPDSNKHSRALRF